MRSARTVRTLAAVAASIMLYAAIVVWFTWPLATHLSTHLPDTWFGCRTDQLVATWILAQDSHALLDHPLQIGEANIYHPTPHALFYGESSFAGIPMFLPTFAATGNPALALNLVFLAAVVLTLASMHFLVWRWTGSHLAAFVAAWTLLTTRWLLWWTSAVPMYAVLFYIPLIMLLTAPTAVVPRRTIWLAVLLVPQCVTTPYHALAVLLPLGALTLIRLARPATRRGGVQLAVALAMAAVFLVPAYAGYVVVRRANPDLVNQSYWARSLSALAVWLPWGLLDRDRPTGVPLVALALVAVGAILILVRRRPAVPASLRERWLHAGYWTAAGIVLSFSPTARWDGQVVTLPQTLLWKIPFLTTVRVPHRLGVVALFGIAALCGLAFAEAARRLDGIRATSGAQPRLVGWRTHVPRGALAALVAGLMLIDYRSGAPLRMPPGYIQLDPPFPMTGPLPASYPIRPAPETTSPLLRLLAERDGVVVEVPIGSGNVGSVLAHSEAMYRSIVHWRPLLNGYMSYWPIDHPRRMALVQRLPDATALSALRRDTGLGFVLVRMAGMSDKARAPWLVAADGQRPDLRLIARDGDDLLFEVLSAPVAATRSGDRA